MAKRNPTRIPVTIVTGFLGAGKTTLLNRVLNQAHGRRIGVIINDFGAINIDAELVSHVNDGMVSLANGCICCAIRSDLISAVLKLAHSAEKPEHIIIESSGVTVPDGLKAVFSIPEVTCSVYLNGIVTVVNAEQLMTLPGPELKLAKQQISGSDLILLNRIDLAEQVMIDEAEHYILKIRSGVAVIKTRHCDIPMSILTGFETANKPGLNSPSGKPFDLNHTTSYGVNIEHAELFESYTYDSYQPLNLDSFKQFLQLLPKSVYRAKGMLFTVDKKLKRYIFQLVGRRATIVSESDWNDKPQQTRIVFITQKATVDFCAIKKALDNCRPMLET